MQLVTILLVAATAAELEPSLEWLKTKPVALGMQVKILCTGVGLVATSFSLTHTLADRAIDFVLNAGVAGAFNKDLALGECVVVKQENFGDLGAEDHDEFLSLEALGLQAPGLMESLLLNDFDSVPFSLDGLKKVKAISVNTVSGCAATIARRESEFHADIESMEGAAVHYVCRQLGIPFLQLRAISNYVTPRNREAWELGKAVAALNRQLINWLGTSPNF